MSNLEKEKILISLPVFGLIVLVVVLYIPDIANAFGYSGRISFLSNLTFMDKTTVLLTFALASFAAVEGFSTFKRGLMEEKRLQIEDAKNELEKAYGPLYTLLNATARNENSLFWLHFEERKKIDEILATYPFMFPAQITELWQQKIRNLKTTLETSDLASAKYEANLDVYLELRNLINEEYSRKVKDYRDLLNS